MVLAAHTWRLINRRKWRGPKKILKPPQTYDNFWCTRSKSIRRTTFLKCKSSRWFFSNVRKVKIILVLLMKNEFRATSKKWVQLSKLSRKRSFASIYLWRMILIKKCKTGRKCKFEFERCFWWISELLKSIGVLYDNRDRGVKVAKVKLEGAKKGGWKFEPKFSRSRIIYYKYC